MSTDDTPNDSIDADTNTADDIEPLANRSELVFLFDGEDFNPNGDPLADDRPRIDKITGICSVTDVRIKRYIREEWLDNSFDIFIKSVTREDGTRMTRDDIVLEKFDGVQSAEDIEDVREELGGNRVADVFLDSMLDVRYFGGTLSFRGADKLDDDARKDLFEAVTEELPPTYTAPVQFQHIRSLHKVHETEHLRRLAPVVQGKSGKEQGTFANDYRIRYGMFRMHGVINENNAENTRLSQRDVERFDKTLWRSLINQTDSRNKVGQAPRLYLRVEFEQDDFHFGDLHHTVELDAEKNDEELTRTADAPIDVTEFVERVTDHSDRINRVMVVASPQLEVHIDEDSYSGDELVDAFQDRDIPVEEVDVLGEVPEQEGARKSIENLGLDDD